MIERSHEDSIHNPVHAPLIEGGRFIALCGSAYAQQVEPPAVTPSSAATDTTSSDSDANRSSASQIGERTSLTAAQIILILQQKPELVVELKSLVADQLQQQGITTQADAITDEMLLTQISTNATLRASITVWLRPAAMCPRLIWIGYFQARPPRTKMNKRCRHQLLSAPVDGLSLSGLDRAQSGSVSGIGQASMTGGGASRARTKGLTPATDRSAKPDKSQSVTDEPESLHLPAPYNLRSLRDLYTQVPPDSVKLKRFGSEVCQAR